MQLTKKWITGFVDGDGCFSIHLEKGQWLRHRFIVSQNRRSVDVLYALKKEFGCGSVHKAGGEVMEFVIEKRVHLRDKVLPHFSKHLLQTTKRSDFSKFATSLSDTMIKKGEQSAPLVVPLDNSFQLSDGWFRGFVDAEGSFVCAIVNDRPIPQFLLGLSHLQRPLLEECQRWLNCGTCRSTTTTFFFQIAGIEQLEKILFPMLETRGSGMLLRTMKRISFQKFRKIVRIIKDGKHKTPEGLEEIKKLQKGLNKHNKTLKKVPKWVLEETVE